MIVMTMNVPPQCDSSAATAVTVLLLLRDPRFRVYGLMLGRGLAVVFTAPAVFASHALDLSMLASARNSIGHDSLLTLL